MSAAAAATSSGKEDDSVDLAGERPPDLSEALKHEMLPDQKLNMRLIRKCCGTGFGAGSASADDLLKLKVLRLDWQRIPAIDNLDVFEQVSDLYLQHNRIRVIENLDFMVNLTFLALGHNSISEIKHLKHLRKLAYLDLSHNKIESFCVGEIPESVSMLELQGNPCCEDDNYRLQLVLNLPRLRRLDSGPVGRGERRTLQQVLGLAVDPASESEDEGDDSGDEDAAEDEETTATTESKTTAPPRPVVRDVDSMPTDPAEVLRQREQLKEMFAKHQAEMAAARRELAADSTRRLEAMAAARMASARAELSSAREEMVNRSRHRQAADATEFEARPEHK